MKSHLLKLFLLLLVSFLILFIPQTMAHETGPSYVVINGKPTTLNIVHAFGHNPGFTLATDLAPEDKYVAGSPINFQINKANYYTPENAPADFKWDFQDGTAPVEGDNVTHTFKSQGTYFVNILARYNPNTPYSIADIVQVNVVTSKNYQLPIAKIMVNGKFITDFNTKTEVPVNKEIELDASRSIGSNLRYYWELGDGTRSRNKVVSHIYTGTGESTYFVLLRVADDQNMSHDTIITLVSSSLKGETAPSSNLFIRLFQPIWLFISRIFSNK